MTQEDEDFDEVTAEELKEAVEKRLAKELAAINASNLSRSELALRLAESRVFSQMAKSVMELRREQSSVLADLIPKAFEEGKKTLAKAGASAAHAENLGRLVVHRDHGGATAAVLASHDPQQAPARGGCGCGNGRAFLHAQYTRHGSAAGLYRRSAACRG